MKMIFDGAPAEIAELLKHLKAEPETEAATPLTDGKEWGPGGTGTTPWYPGGTACCTHAETARTAAESAVIGAGN